MRMRLFHKLFVAITLASFASIVAFAMTAHWSMQRNFLRYLHDAHEQHMSALATTLATHYAAAGNWEGLRDDRRAWRRLLRDSRPQSAADPTAPSGPVAGGRRRGPPIALFDADRNPLIGKLRFADAVTTLAIKVDGETAGWLGMPPIAAPAAPPAVRYARRQSRMLMLAAAAAACVSIIAAFVLARRLATPIRAIGEGARTLAGGDFDTRLPPLGQDEIGQLAADFNVLARTLQQNESARQRWFADVSHELRTPLSIMRGELEAVRDGVRPHDERTIQSLAQETTRLEQLVDALYDFARADIGALDYEFSHCNLTAVLRASVDRFATRLDAAGLTCEPRLQTSIDITADAQRLGQLFDNLLENCCRYVHAPGRVRITATPTDGNAAIIFEDTGPAPDDDQLEQLFEPLFRADSSRNRAFGGAGLGLALCRRIAAGHGGSISAARSALGGLRFTLTLPLREA